MTKESRKFLGIFFGTAHTIGFFPLQWDQKRHLFKPVQNWRSMIPWFIWVAFLWMKVIYLSVVLLKMFVEQQSIHKMLFHLFFLLPFVLAGLHHINLYRVLDIYQAHFQKLVEFNDMAAGKHEPQTIHIHHTTYVHLALKMS